MADGKMKQPDDLRCTCARIMSKVSKQGNYTTKYHVYGCPLYVPPGERSDG